MSRARRYFVEGRVQGVGFRFFVQHVARELGLRGYVRNRRDGRVEVYAKADEAALAELKARLERGPPGSHVTAVQEAPAANERVSDFFEIRPTS